MELEVLDETTVGDDFDLLVLDDLVGVDLLHLEGLLLLHGHADLAHLEDDLEVGEEGEVVGGVGGVREPLEDITLLGLVVFGLLVDLVGNLLDEVSGHVGGVALLNGGGESFLGGEPGVVNGELSSVVASDELGNAVHDVEAKSVSGAGAGADDFLDGGDGFLVAVLGLLGLGLVLGGQHDLEIADLTFVGLGLVLLGLNGSLAAGELLLVLSLLVSDLFERNERV